MADHELVYQERVLKITDDLQQLNIVDGSELDLQGTLKLQEPREGNHRIQEKTLKLIIIRVILKSMIFLK